MPPQTNSPLLALTTDFGADSAYVAILKGALLSRLPQARLVDLLHHRPNASIRDMAIFLRRVHFYYPAGTIHVVAADPGIGPDRVLIAEAAGQVFLAADNGILGLVLEAASDTRVYAAPLATPTTFLARDVLAPLAARLSEGAAPAELAAPVTDWLPLALPRPVREGNGWRGEILLVDGFGNLLTNFTPAELPALPAVLEIAGETVSRSSASFREMQTGHLYALWGAEGWLEVVEAGGSAAARLGVQAGEPVRLR